MTKAHEGHPRTYEAIDTTRPETPELEGRVPLPEEITGQASGTDGDLVKLFKDDGASHMADGFRGGSEDEPDARKPDLE